MTAKLTIADRIALKRKEMKLTQQQVADYMGVTRSLVGQVETGAVNPNLQFLEKFTRMASCTYDYLIEGKEIEQNKEGQKEPEPDKNVRFVSGFNRTSDENNALNEEKANYRTKKYNSVTWDLDTSKKDIQILPIALDKTGGELILAVPNHAEAGYSTGYQDPEYISELPTFTLPWLGQGTYRAFQIRGNSMESEILSGDWVVCRYVTSLKHLYIGAICVILLRDEGIVCKRVEKQRGGTVILHSNNPKYKPYQPDPSEILEMWEVKLLMRDFF